jgi:hypothetical protein
MHIACSSRDTKITGLCLSLNTSHTFSYVKWKYPNKTKASRLKRTNRTYTLPLFSVCLKNYIFWDITLCSPLSVNRRFGGTYRLHLQGRRNKFSEKPVWKQVASRVGFLLGLSFPEDGGDMFRRNIDWHLTDYTWRYIPEDGTLHNHGCENLKSYIACVCVCVRLSLGRNCTTSRRNRLV